MKYIKSDQGALNLACGILGDAKDQYIKSILSKNGSKIDGRPVEYIRGESERFYKSDWFRILSAGSADDYTAEEVIMSLRHAAVRKYDEILADPKQMSRWKRRLRSKEDVVKYLDAPI